MEKLISDLKKVVTFKETVDVGDIVLIAAKEPQMLVYALVVSIDRDDSRRDEWYQVEMHLLSLPPQRITWTLRPEQMSGQEIFTMDGKERFMKGVVFDTEKTKKYDAKKKTETKSPLKRIK